MLSPTTIWYHLQADCPLDDLILFKAFNNVATGLEATILELVIASFVRSVSACPSRHMILYVAKCLYECSLKDCIADIFSRAPS